MARGRSLGGPLLVVDEDRAFCEQLLRLLSDAGFDAVAVHEGRHVLAGARLQRPQLVVLEVNLPGLSGYEVCRELREEFGPGLPIMFVSAERTAPFDRVAGLLIGADDYLAKPVAADELLARVRALLRRAQAHDRSDLTARELEILSLLAQGLGQREIARRLVISGKTVATHIDHILAKLGVHSRAEAVALAYREHLVAT